MGCTNMKFNKDNEDNESKKEDPKAPNGGGADDSDTDLGDAIIRVAVTVFALLLAGILVFLGYGSTLT